MKAFNALHFKSSVDFICEFIPQLIFMGCTFVYMDFLIFYKWVTPFVTTTAQVNAGEDAPSIITVMINWFLKIGKPLCS